MNDRNELLKIIRINAYIQRGMGEVTLDGKPVECVALDRTCTFKAIGEDDLVLTNDQLDDLFIQSFGYTKNSRAVQHE